MQQDNVALFREEGYLTHSLVFYSVFPLIFPRFKEIKKSIHERHALTGFPSVLYNKDNAVCVHYAVVYARRGL